MKNLMTARAQDDSFIDPKIQIAHIYAAKNDTIAKVFFEEAIAMSQDDLDFMTDKLGQPRLDANQLGYLSPLNYPNEPARHKLLDMIGDMSLCGFRLQAQIVALRPGHSFNTKCCKQLREKILSEQ
jgi:hypothetical protein